MHQRIARAPGGTAADGRTSGITGLVYNSIRGVTRIVGGSLDALLGALAPLLEDRAEQAEPSPQREAVVAALNGVLGDHLAATGNPLSTTMALRHQGRAIMLDKSALRQQFPHGGKLLILVHGLCMNDLQWQREGHDHGAELARDEGYIAINLHYNTGLHIADNGLAFAGLLQRLLDSWPQPVTRLVLLAHSMGGLVARSALHQGALAQQTWPQHTDDLICLGTPHAGAALEKAGHWLDIVLDTTPYAAPLARLGKVRSAGITDLREGQVLHDGAAAPLPASVRCWAIAAHLGDSEKALKGRLLGDGLVTVDSALGRHKDPARALAFAADRQWVAGNLNHMQLLSDAGVHARLREWLRSGD